MTLRRSLRTLPLISLVLVACANTGDAGGTGRRRPNANDLIGVTWVLDDASVAGLVDEVPPGAQATITFEEGQAHGTAACNSYGGAYEASDDGSLSFAGFAVTEMGCDPPLMTLESAYLEVLGGVTSFEVDDTLRLSNGEATLSFSREVPPEPLPLVGTTWTLTSIFSGDAVSSVVSGTEVTAVFAADETLSGSAGCNRFSGTYTVAGIAVVVLATGHHEDGVRRLRHGAGARVPRRDERRVVVTPSKARS